MCICVYVYMCIYIYIYIYIYICLCICLSAKFVHGVLRRSARSARGPDVRPPGLLRQRLVHGGEAGLPRAPQVERLMYIHTSDMFTHIHHNSMTI